MWNGSYAVIPDMHENEELLEKAINLHKAGWKLIFLGDYVDSFTATGNGHKYLSKVIELIKENKSIALYGNHDYHYLNLDPYYRCTGFQENISVALHGLFSDNQALFKYAAYVNKTLFTHAGLTKEFVKQCNIRYGTQSIKQVCELINAPIKEVYYTSNRNGYCGPLWARKDYYQTKQIFGHTFNKYPVIYGKAMCIDCETPFLIW